MPYFGGEKGRVTCRERGLLSRTIPLIRFDRFDSKPPPPRTKNKHPPLLFSRRLRRSIQISNRNREKLKGKMSDVFEGYERHYSELSANLTKKFDVISRRWIPSI